MGTLLNPLGIRGHTTSFTLSLRSSDPDKPLTSALATRPMAPAYPKSRLEHDEFSVPRKCVVAADRHMVRGRVARCASQRPTGSGQSWSAP